MKDDNEEKKVLISSAPQKITKEDRKQLQQLLLDLVEEKTAEKRFSDKHFDRENEKGFVLHIGEISVDEVKRYISSKARPYDPMYPIKYFREVYRLFGFPAAEADKYFRRKEVAMFTRGVIYARFDKGVLMSMHVLNPYTGYIKRTFKHFQFMTDEGIEKLAVIIGQAVEMMETCSTIHEFRKKWSAEYGVPYQDRMFE